MSKLAEHLFSYSMIAAWLIICAACQRFDLVSRFANKGVSIIGSEYYRYATSLLLHSNIVHALFNGLAMFFVGRYLEPQISSWKLLVFSVLIGIAAEWVFSAIFRNSISVGGSPIVFALIGLIVAMQISKTEYFKFQLGTWYGNWTLAYSVLANLPFFSDHIGSTLTIHGLALVLGIGLGYAGIALRMI